MAGTAFLIPLAVPEVTALFTCRVMVGSTTHSSHWAGVGSHSTGPWGHLFSQGRSMLSLKLDSDAILK